MSKLIHTLPPLIVKKAIGCIFPGHVVAEVAAEAGGDLLTGWIAETDAQRSAERLLRRVQAEVVDQLERYVRAEFAGLPDDEQSAAVSAVEKLLDPEAIAEQLASADLDPDRLEEVVLRQGGKSELQQLSEDSRRLAGMLLKGACVRVVKIASKLPDFQLAGTKETLARLRTMENELCALRAGETSTEVQRAALDAYLSAVEHAGGRPIYAGLQGAGPPFDEVAVALQAEVDGVEGDRFEGDAVAAVSRALAAGRGLVVLLLGGAGAGKSVTLRQLERAACRGDGLPFGLGRCIPLRVRLPNFLGSASAKPLGERLRDSLDETGGFVFGSPLALPPDFLTVWPRLAGCRWLLLLDALDEVSSADLPGFEEHLRALLSLARKRYHMHIVIAARDSAAAANLAQAYSAAVRLKPLDETRQKELVERLLPQDRSRSLLNVKLAAADAAAILETPLLLALACEIHGSEASEADPGLSSWPDCTPVDLLGRAARIALRRPATGGRLRGEITERLSELLCEAALASAQTGGRNDLAAATTALRNRLFEAAGGRGIVTAAEDARDVIDVLCGRSGILSREGHRLVWLHATLRDYLAARALLDRHGPGGPAVEEWMSRWQDEAVAGVARFLAALATSQLVVGDDEQLLRAAADRLVRPVLQTDFDFRCAVQEDACDAAAWSRAGNYHEHLQLMQAEPGRPAATMERPGPALQFASQVLLMGGQMDPALERCFLGALFRRHGEVLGILRAPYVLARGPVAVGGPERADRLLEKLLALPRMRALAQPLFDGLYEYAIGDDCKYRWEPFSALVVLGEPGRVRSAVHDERLRPAARAYAAYVAHVLMHEREAPMLSAQLASFGHAADVEPSSEIKRLASDIVRKAHLEQNADLLERLAGAPDLITAIRDAAFAKLVELRQKATGAC